MNIQNEKEIIFEQFRKINDIHLIRAVKNLLDYARKKEKEFYDIPEEHQNVVMERYDETSTGIGE